MRFFPRPVKPHLSGRLFAGLPFETAAALRRAPFASTLRAQDKQAAARRRCPLGLDLGRYAVCRSCLEIIRDVRRKPDFQGVRLAP